ncbi:hypothetical protein LINPERHAP1_LOCUS22834 [Linum perenne]
MEKKDSLRRMVVDAKWDGLKDVHTKKGKDATTTILNLTYWKAVNLCLKVFEPLVKVLILVDGDVKPYMGFVYGEIVKAKREIKEAFGNVEIRYREVMAIVDKKMRGRLDGSLQLTAYMLNPYYSYATHQSSMTQILPQPSSLVLSTFTVVVTMTYKIKLSTTSTSSSIRKKDYLERRLQGLMRTSITILVSISSILLLHIVISG